MPIVYRKFVAKELPTGQLRDTLKFAIDYFKVDYKTVTIDIWRILSDDSHENRDDLTLTDLESICNLKSEFRQLEIRFEDINEAVTRIEFTNARDIREDVISVSIRSENEESIKFLFDLFSTKLKLEPAGKEPSIRELVASKIPSFDTDDLASRLYKCRHALLIKPDDIKYLDKFLTNSFEENTYIARCIDDTKIPFSSLEKMLAYENASFKRIISLEIEARSKQKSISSLNLKIGSHGLSFRSTAEFFLMYKEIDWGIKTEQELIQRLTELRPWYWWLRKISFSTMLPVMLFLLSVWVNIVTLTQKLRGIYIPKPQPNLIEFTFDEKFIFTIAILFALVAIGELIDRIVGYLFPKVFFCLGRQAHEFNRRQKMSSFLFGGIVLTIILSIIANQLTKYFFG